MYYNARGMCEQSHAHTRVYTPVARLVPLFRPEFFKKKTTLFKKKN